MEEERTRSYHLAFLIPDLLLLTIKTTLPLVKFGSLSEQNSPYLCASLDNKLRAVGATVPPEPSSAQLTWSMLSEVFRKQFKMYGLNLKSVSDAVAPVE
jgi:hypothetical protein